jgi:dihydroneopterin aldolase
MMKLDAVHAQSRIKPDYVGECLRVRVRGLRLDAEVGVYDSERGRRQPIVVDLEAEVAAEASRPGVALGDAVDYAALAEIVRAVAGRRHHDLLEGLAQAIADAIFADQRITRLELSIDKTTALADADSVGVSLERWR